MRDPELVARDILEGDVSAEWAKRIYGVIVQGDRAVAVSDTLSERARIRKARLGYTLAARSLATTASEDNRSPVIDALISNGEHLYCAQCHTNLGSSAQDARLSLVTRVSELGDAGPWIAKRWQGRSPEVQLWQYFCPSCGSSIRVEQYLVTDSRPLTDTLARILPIPTRSRVPSACRPRCPTVRRHQGRRRNHDRLIWARVERVHCQWRKVMR